MKKEKNKSAENLIEDINKICKQYEAEKQQLKIKYQALILKKINDIYDWKLP